MYRVCGLQLGPNFVLRLTAFKNFYFGLTVGKMHAFAVLVINIYDQMVAATQILQLRLTIQIQKLKC